MKKTLFVFGLILLVVAACKKKEPDPTCSDGIQNQSETGVDCGGPCAACPSTLCDGNGTTSWFPLALNNSWFYKGSGSNQFTDNITGTQVYGSFTYHKIENTLGGTNYLRQASNGDIMIYNSATSTEYLYVPGSPTVNQTWTFPMQFSATRKVISTNATLTTSTCTYTGLLKIQNFNGTGGGETVMYFKKGLGMVSTDQIYPGIIVTNLNTVTLN
jgi:hypothetical protein